jgi:hypothetical protein
MNDQQKTRAKAILEGLMSGEMPSDDVMASSAVSHTAKSIVGSLVLKMFGSLPDGPGRMSGKMHISTQVALGGLVPLAITVLSKERRDELRTQAEATHEEHKPGKRGADALLSRDEILMAALIVAFTEDATNEGTDYMLTCAEEFMSRNGGEGSPFKPMTDAREAFFKITGREPTFMQPTIK